MSKFRWGLLRLPSVFWVIMEYPEMLCWVQKLVALEVWRMALLLLSCLRIIQKP